MVRTDEKLITSLLRVSGDTDFETVKEWLQSSFQDQLTRNIALRGEESTRGQGYAEALQDILKVIKDPRKLADKLKK